jgi:serine/threonine-protein kinase Chk2
VPDCQDPPGDNFESCKKVRRSERLSHREEDDHKKTPISTRQQLPSPVTHPTDEEAEAYQSFKEGTATPPEGRPSQVQHRAEDTVTPGQGAFSSPPQDTQAYPSQLVDPHGALSDEVEDEEKEGVWGYLFPLDTRYGGRCLVMKKRGACPLPDTVGAATPEVPKRGRQAPLKEEKRFEDKLSGGLPSGGYLIGRHPECGKSRLRYCARILCSAEGY